MKAVAIVGLVIGAAAVQGNSQQFTGSWTAEFQGKTFVRLELKPSGPSVSGNIDIGDIELDTKGELKYASDLPRTPTALIDVTLKGNTLSFSRKEGKDIDRFEFRLQDGGSGELQFLVSDEDRKELAGQGVPAPKPFRMKKG